MLTRTYAWLLSFPGKLHREDGQGLVEYALILLLIAMAVVVAVKLFGGELLQTYEKIQSAIPIP